MNRLTRHKDKYPCRIAAGCPAEEWMYGLYHCYSDNDVCENCPFEKYINELAQFEDEKEKMEDDKK